MLARHRRRGLDGRRVPVAVQLMSDVERVGARLKIASLTRRLRPNPLAIADNRYDRADWAKLRFLPEHWGWPGAQRQTACHTNAASKQSSTIHVPSATR